MTRLPPLSPTAQERCDQAEVFLRLYAQETQVESAAALARWREVSAELAATGSYQLSSAELAYGAQVAWRNSARCVGRAYWPALELRDLRHITSPSEVFAQLRQHLHLAWNGGKLRALISVFGPGVRIINGQLLRYAGYALPSGEVLGDPQHLHLTSQLRQWGWTPPAHPSAFDVLPLAIEVGQRVHLFEWQAGDVQEVALSHPTCPAIANLALKWHALPVISDMHLEVGGLTFECAPFNGWYLQTEIAARNLADTQRYNQLPQVARALGLSTQQERTLWRDRALLELNVAVLHSFDAAGVTLADHHTVSEQFVRFEQREQRLGRAVHGEWSWLIAPLSPATSPIWPRRYRQGKGVRPAFVHRTDHNACPVKH